MFPWILMGFFFFSISELQSNILTSGLLAITEAVLYIFSSFTDNVLCKADQCLKIKTAIIWTVVSVSVCVCVAREWVDGVEACVAMTLLLCLFGTYPGLYFWIRHLSVLGIVLRCNAAAGPLGCPLTCTCLRIRLHHQSDLILSGNTTSACLSSPEDRTPTQMKIISSPLLLYIKSSKY